MYNTTQGGATPPKFMPQAPNPMATIGRPSLKGLSDCGCQAKANLNGLAGGDLTDAEVNAIMDEHFKAITTTQWITISGQAAGGNYDGLKAEVRKLTEKVCLKGAAAKADGIWLDYRYYVVGGIAGIASYAIYKSIKPKSKKRGK